MSGKVVILYFQLLQFEGLLLYGELQACKRLSQEDLHAAGRLQKVVGGQNVE